MRDQIEALLEAIRPHLRIDGCDVVLEEVTTDGVVRVRLVGSRTGCPMSRLTLVAGIERRLQEHLVGVQGVELVG